VERRKYLTITGKREVPPIYYQPGISGTYELFIGVNEYAEFKLELPGTPFLEKIYLHSRVLPLRKWKEIQIGRFTFSTHDRIGIHQSPATTMNPLHAFSDLGYLKLVPAENTLRPKRKSARLPGMALAFYSEPFSLAYYGELRTPNLVETMVREYQALHVDKVMFQVGRYGSTVLYPSRIVAPANPEAHKTLRGDDGQHSNGIWEMQSQMDILKIMTGLCRQHSLHLSANLGTNSAYSYPREKSMESEFSRNHPEHHHPQYPYLLDFRKPEVRAYLADIIKEIGEYEVDGVSLDYCRYPSGQTVESLTATMAEIKARLGPAKWSRIEFSARFPVDDPIYFQACEKWVENDLIDLIIPSRLTSCHPAMNLVPYIKLARCFDKKTYAGIDTWSRRHETLPLIIAPDELITLSNGYRRQGVDGVFFYQSEQIIENLFLRRAVRNLFGPRSES
jgi:hypothetical protein